MLAFLVATGAFWGRPADAFWPPRWEPRGGGRWAVRTIDDRVNLSPWLRVGATIAAGVGLWVGDLGWNIFPGSGLDLALTVAWVLGLVNAYNVMDNVDGACGSVAAAASVGIGAFALVKGDVTLAAVALGLVGGCLGFLCSNLARRARISLATAAACPSASSWRPRRSPARRSPIADLGYGAALTAALLVGLVTFDTTLVVISRRRRVVSLLTGGRDHLTTGCWAARLGALREPWPPCN